MNLNQIILSAKTGATAPTLVTPDFVGQLYVDTTSQVIYYAQSVTTGDYAELVRVDDLTTALSTKMDVDGTNSDIEILNFKINEPKPGHAEGKVFYDAEEHALVCYNDESQITQQLGHEHYIRVFNDTGVTILNGKVVQLTGAETVEFRPKIELAQADSRDNASVIGMTTHDILDQTFGYITILGMIHDLDTSAYNSGDILYLSTTTPGELVDIVPQEGEIVFKIGSVVRVHATEGSVYVNLSDRGALTEFSLIRDVLGTTWKNGLVVSPNSPNDQSVDYTNGEYFISGTLYEITPSGNLDLTSYYAALANNEHALLKIYVDEDQTLKISVGTPIALNQQASEPTIPVNTIAIALVEVAKDTLGNPIDINSEAVIDQRQTLSKQAGTSLDEFVRVGDSDTVSKHLEDALSNNGNVTFTVENEGGNETLRADASLDAEDIPTDELGVTVQDKLDSLQSEIDTHEADTANPHAVTKAQVGLGSVPNLDTTDAVNNEHIQGTDQTLDDGGANEVSASEIRSHLDNLNDPHDTQASQVETDTSNFDGVLSGADDTVQKALETIDELGNKVKSQYFRDRAATTNLGDHKVQAVAQNGSFRVGFDIPLDAVSIVGIDLVFAPTSTIAASQTVTGNSDYGSIGENVANHSETSATIPIAGTAGQLTYMSMLAIFTNASAGDICGALISLNGIGTGISLFGVRVRYL